MECHRFLAFISERNELIINLGSFGMDKVALVDASGIERLIKAFGNLYIPSAACVDDIAAERNSVNKSNETLPPVVPHQLAVLLHY